MANAYFEVPDPINEPIKSYGPGSSEKEAVKFRIQIGMIPRQPNRPIFEFRRNNFQDSPKLPAAA